MLSQPESSLSAAYYLCDYSQNWVVTQQVMSNLHLHNTYQMCKLKGRQEFKSAHLMDSTAIKHQIELIKKKKKIRCPPQKIMIFISNRH